MIWCDNQHPLTCRMYDLLWIAVPHYWGVLREVGRGRRRREVTGERKGRERGGGGGGGEGKRAGVGKGETKPWKPSKRAPPVRNPTQHISYVYSVGLELHQGWEGRKKKI